MATNASDPRKDAILIIDDEPHVLQGLRRQLHKRFDLTVADGGDQAISILRERGPFAVVVCDMNMPGRNGIDVLADVAEIAPDAVRIMLTGQANLNTAMNAVNRGNIFRFFTKPCPTDLLADGLEAGLEQYRLVTAERDLLNKTLAGSIKVLTDVLAMIDPDSFGRTEHACGWAREVAGALGLKRHLWKLEMATMLAPIGLAALPPDVAKKARSNLELSQAERDMVEASAETAHKLICNIPRLQDVATYVLYQGKNVDGSGFPRDDKAGDDIPIGARIIRILGDLASSLDRGDDLEDAFALMQKHEGIYDQKLLELMAPVIVGHRSKAADSETETTEIQLSMLRDGDQLLTTITDLERGDVILAKGAIITELYIKRLSNLRKLRKLTDMVRVRRQVENTVLADTG